MKKALKIVGKILLGLLILIAAFLIITTIYNQIMLKKEDKLLGDYPGQLTEVDGHKLNVYVTGEGEHTLVFLPAAGEVTPVYSFEPLYDRLTDTCKCAVVERFGFGMSDVVDTDRDFETIVRQDREALLKSGVEAPYILCPYSISGLEALTWSQMYPDEVEAIVGIDMAFPESYSGTDTDISSRYRLISAARNTGVLRLILTDSMFPETNTADQIKISRSLACRKYINRCTVSEGLNIPAAIDRITNGEKTDIPMYLFLTNGEGTGSTADEWRGYAHSYCEGLTDVRYTEFDCSHSSIVKTENESMSTGIKEFLSGSGR